MKRILSILSCVLVLVSMLTVGVSAIEYPPTEYVTMRGYNGEKLFITYDPAKGESPFFDPANVQYLELLEIYGPEGDDTSYLLEYVVKGVPKGGVSFNLTIHYCIGPVIQAVARVYTFQLQASEGDYDDGEIDPVNIGAELLDPTSYADDVGAAFVLAYDDGVNKINYLVDEIKIRPDGDGVREFHFYQQYSYEFSDDSFDGFDYVSSMRFGGYFYGDGNVSFLNTYDGLFKYGIYNDIWDDPPFNLYYVNNGNLVEHEDYFAGMTGPFSGEAVFTETTLVFVLPCNVWDGTIYQEPTTNTPTVTPDQGELIDGVRHINMRHYMNDLCVIEVYPGEVLETRLDSLVGLRKEDEFWFDEDNDGVNDYKCIYLRVTDEIQDGIAYDIELTSYDLSAQEFKLVRVYHLTLGRQPEGENSWRDQYNELVEQYTTDGVTDWYELVKYLLMQNEDVRLQGQTDGYRQGYAKGYDKGYDDGLAEGSDGGVTFYGFLKTVMLAPVTMLKEVTNFEIPMPGGGSFNIWGAVSFVITVILAIFVITKLRGK